MSETIEAKCLSKGVKLTDQRKVIVKVLSESKEKYGDKLVDHKIELYGIKKKSQ